MKIGLKGIVALYDVIVDQTGTESSGCDLDFFLIPSHEEQMFNTCLHGYSTASIDLQRTLSISEIRLTSYVFGNKRLQQECVGR